MTAYNNYDQLKMNINDQVVRKEQGPVTCLGINFSNDNERKKHFTELLRQKLKDPEFRKIEGFPIGEDEDILALSDPPYYTICPNPWIENFIEEWENENHIQSDSNNYHREPFASDVNEGKNHPIYNAHSYHTKVPHKAIMRYILHYTEPGDIIFDGFCGTGMTGVAAQLCGNRDAVVDLGYQVKNDGSIFQEITNLDGKKEWIKFSNLGNRKAVLNDLSTVATFISMNYNFPTDISTVENRTKKIIAKIHDEIGWVYNTKHINNEIGIINYIIWSDVFICPSCGEELVFWDISLNKESMTMLDKFHCNKCKSEIEKSQLEHKWTSNYDSVLKTSIRQTKREPVLINYTINGKRYDKRPDEYDFEIEKRVSKIEIETFFPSDLIPKGDKTAEAINCGITHSHHFYTKRSLFVLSRLWSELEYIPKGRMILTSILTKTASLMHNVGFKGGKINLAGAMPNAIFIPSILAERNIFTLTQGKLDDFVRVGFKEISDKQIIETKSFSEKVNSNLFGKFDYIFIDPPFGSNLQYSELNFLWESWLKVRTQNNVEATINKTLKRNIDDYRESMTKCFLQAYHMLKSGHWMTVEFSNTDSKVWNSIQSALSDVGFIIGSVSSLNKGQGTYNSQTNSTSVKKDLIISAYKPDESFERRFFNEALTEEGVWDFIRTHLSYLPVIKTQGNEVTFISERDPRILFDQMVAYFVRKGFMVPISSHEFQIELSQRFVERDGMYFLAEQAAEYDRKKLTSGAFVQMDLVMSDEATAIDWLRYLLREKPQTFAEINPQFMTKLGGWSKYEANLDLRELLSQNFISYDGKGQVPEQIHTYLSTNWREYRNLSKDDPGLVAKAKDRWYVPDPNKAGDLEKLRERSLLKEFDLYKNAPKKLKQFRIEAVRAGFKKAWQDRDYATIVSVAEKIPGNVLEEDPKLLMWYDQAMTRLGR